MRHETYGGLNRAYSVQDHKAERAGEIKEQVWRKLEQELEKFKAGYTVNHKLDRKLKNGFVESVGNGKVTVRFGIKRMDLSPLVLVVVKTEEKSKADWRKNKE